jgi:hypothetical protein
VALIRNLIIMQRVELQQEVNQEVGARRLEGLDTRSKLPPSTENNY